MIVVGIALGTLAFAGGLVAGFVVGCHAAYKVAEQDWMDS